MDIRDLMTLAGLVNPEMLNKLEPTVEAECDCGCGMPDCGCESVEEADAAGFDQATTEPNEEIMDDPMQSMGSDADLSLRRYLKAKGDHVTVDEEIYPDHTVESVTEAYESFKAESATPNMDKEIAAYFKQIKTPAKGWGGKLKAESEDLEEGRMKDSVIHDSETMSKEEFAKKHGKELADEMYESVTDESVDMLKKLAGL